MSMISAAPQAGTCRPTRSPQLAIVVSENLLSATLVQEKFALSGLRVGVRNTLESAMQVSADPRPVVVWIVSWPNEHALLHQAEACAQVMPLLVLGTGCPASVQSQLLLAGARGYVDHSEGWEALQQAVTQIAAGRRRFSPEILCQSIDLLQRGDARQTQRATAGLTAREQLIANMVVRGACNKEIAVQLNLSESTVKTHLQHIFAKLGVSSRLALALILLKANPSGSLSDNA
jgi:DNA-binding NarL/FixJ family response regulator